MLTAMLDTGIVMGLAFGAVAVAYVLYAVAHLPMYLLGKRK